MAIQIQANYDQMFLLPPTLEELVPANHQARFIRDFVDMLSLEELGFRIPEAIEGRPPYAVDLLL
jgi:transposase